MATWELATCSRLLWRYSFVHFDVSNICTPTLDYITSNWTSKMDRYINATVVSLSTGKKFVIQKFYQGQLDDNINNYTIFFFFWIILKQLIYKRTVCVDKANMAKLGQAGGRIANRNGYRARTPKQKHEFAVAGGKGNTGASYKSKTPTQKTAWQKAGGLSTNRK